MTQITTPSIKRGNPNIREINKTGPITETGKFKSKLNLYKRESHIVPEKYKELFDWYWGLKTNEVDFLLELKNIYGALKNLSAKSIVEKLESGKTLSKQELDQFRLMVDILEKSHKLKYGEKSRVDHVVTIADIRRHMIPKKVIEVDNQRDNRE